MSTLISENKQEFEKKEAMQREVVTPKIAKLRKRLKEFEENIEKYGKYTIEDIKF